MKRRGIGLILSLLLILSLTACTQTSEAVPEGSGQTEAAGSGIPVAQGAGASVNDMFSARDMEIGYADYVTVALKDGGSAADGPGVSINGDTVTIVQEGIYRFTGTLTNGQVLVDATKDSKLQLVLDNVSIGNASSAPLYIKQADKVFLTTALDSENSLSVTGKYVQTDDNNIDAAIYSRDDLTLNGAGRLTISAAYGHGVVSKDDLVITSGAYRITAAGSGLNANDSVRISGGSFAVESGKDAIHSENKDDAALGFIYISGGEFALTAGSDGLDGAAYLQMDGGDLTISAVDDGMHADGAVLMNGGNISITKSYEGIEGQSISIAGGRVSVAAADDGLNAAGGNDQSGITGKPDANKFAVDANSFISISGGAVYINASGDGIDSNGSLLVSGGETYVSGPADNGNGALDYNGQATISGGILVAAGSAGMAQNFGSGSTQGAMLVNLSTPQTGSIILKDESGAVLVDFAPEKQYQSVVVSAPGVKKGGAYTLTAGSEIQTIEMTDILYGSGGMGGGMRGDRGQLPPGGMPNGKHDGPNSRSVDQPV